MDAVTALLGLALGLLLGNAVHAHHRHRGLERRIRVLEAGAGSSATDLHRLVDRPTHAEITSLLDADRPIAAIRLLRHHTGLGLREAKAVIDKLAA